MNEEYLISKGWERRDTFEGDYCWFKPKQKSKYGVKLSKALEVQEETDTMDRYGIVWKMFPERYGFGHRVMFAFKGERWYRLFGIYKDEKMAEEILAECEDLYENAEDFKRWKTEPFFWRDYSDAPKYIFKKGNYGDSIYLVRTYTELAKICFEFLKKYVKTRNAWEIDVPTKPSTTVEDTPKEFKDEMTRRWESYDRQLADYQKFEVVRNRFIIIEKDWKSQWPEYAKEVIDWVNQLYYSPDFRIEDFNDPKDIAAN
jgi:hypothetical protein